MNFGLTLRPMRFLPLVVATLALVLATSAADARQDAPQSGTDQSASSRSLREAPAATTLSVDRGKPALAMTGTEKVMGGEVSAIRALPQAGAGTAVTVALPGEVALFALLAGTLILVGLAVARHRPTV